MTKNRDEFIATMTQEGLPLDMIRLVLRDAATLQRLALKDCNEGLTADETNRERQAQVRITGRCAPHGITPVYSGDPRGACVKLHVPSGKTNDWGQVGICVPTPRY